MALVTLGSSPASGVAVEIKNRILSNVKQRHNSMENIKGIIKLDWGILIALKDLYNKAEN